ncbi:MAG: PEGA domain-containing protein [Deltaproteobacteria bacterium]|nr:PEGA domain-containing protein [Deltaproteobacteria bacterium]
MSHERDDLWALMQQGGARRASSSGAALSLPRVVGRGDSDVLDQVLDALAEPRDPELRPSDPYGLPVIAHHRTPLRLPGLLGHAVAGIAVAPLVVFASWVVTSLLRETPPAPVVATQEGTGTIAVSSEPSGAEIWVDGQRTGKSTPAELDGVVTEQAVEVSVRRPGFVAEPGAMSVRIPDGALLTTAHFQLKEATTFTILSDPTGARLELDGALMPGTTPFSLAPVPVGASRHLRVSHSGFVAKRLELRAKEPGAEVVQAELIPARRISIDSEPPGADVALDGEPVGMTPIEIEVPAKACFELRFERPGFAPATRSCRGAKGERLRVELRELPLRDALTKAERRRLSKASATLRWSSRSLALAKLRVARAERSLDRAAKAPHLFVGRLSKLQAKLDRAQRERERLEARVDQLRSEVDSIKHEGALRRSGLD